MEKGHIFENRYKIIKPLEVRSFRQVYKVSDKNNHGKKVSLKLLPKSSPQFEIEKEPYSKFSSIPGTPKLVDSGSTATHNYLVFKLLGKSLQNLYSVKKFSLGCILEISIQLVTILESFHSLSYIHRDLKLENIYRGLKGTDKKTKIYLANFGLCKKYRDPLSKVHLRYSENAGIFGDLLFCSANGCKGIEQSRRDDIESWFYLILYLVKGTLPWENQVSKEGFQVVSNLKTGISIEKLCEKTPVEFQRIFYYIKSLKFNEIPNYNYLREVLMSIGNNGIKFGLDWSVKNNCSELLKVNKQKKKKKRNKLKVFNENDFKKLENNEKERIKSSDIKENQRRKKKTDICEYPEFKSRKLTIRIVLNS